MGTLSSYAMMLFGISTMLYIMGYASPFLAIVGEVSTDTPILNTLINSLYTTLTNPIFLLGLAIAGVTSLAGNFGFSSAGFLAPLMFFVGVSFIANFFVLPTSFIFQVGFPEILKLIINSFLNVFLMLGLLEFIRGGSV